jgi:hypothetical protein
VNTKKWFIVVSALVTLVDGCTDKGTNQVIEPPGVELALVDISVTEAFIHLLVTGRHPDDVIVLQRDGVEFATLKQGMVDSIFRDTALNPSSSYSYSAIVKSGGTVTLRTADLHVQTLAPTNHNITWRTFILGDGNYSSLRDIAIVNDTSAYAVGEIYLTDTSGFLGYPPYNLAKWDGTTWKLAMISVNYRGNAITPPLTGIRAFSDTDIWVTGGVPINGNGTSWQMFHLFDMGVLGQNDGGVGKIYASLPSKMYFVGEAGTIVLYDGTWQRLESGTKTRINDAWGVQNPLSEEEEIYMPVSDYFVGSDEELLRVTTTAVEPVAQTEINVSSVWSNRGYPLFICGGGVLEGSGDHWDQIPFATATYKTQIRGSALNDIFVVGLLGFVAHYNGVDWKVYSDVYAADYMAIAMNNRVVMLVGEKNGRAVITVGMRAG